MSFKSVIVEQWLSENLGPQSVQWEEAIVAEAIANVFGYYALQVGADHQPLLAANRMAHRWVAQCQASGDASDADIAKCKHGPVPALVLDPHHLPFQANQLDLLVLPHTLEQSGDPRQVVREAERVLLPEGRLLVCGVNPWSPLVAWAIAKHRLSQWRASGALQTLAVPNPIGVERLRDWLQLLGFEIDQVVFGGSQSAFNKKRCLAQQDDGMGRAATRGNRLARAYVIVATKKVPGMRLLKSPWQGKKTVNRLAGQKVKSADGPVHRS